MNTNFDLLFEIFYPIIRQDGIVDLDCENKFRKIFYGKDLKEKLTEFSLKTIGEMEQIRGECFPTYFKFREILDSGKNLSLKNFAMFELIRILIPDPIECDFILSQLVDDRRYYGR